MTIEWGKSALLTWPGLATAVLALVAGCANPTPSLFEQIKDGAAHQHVESGETMVEQNRLDEAIKEFEEAIRLNPRLATAHSKLGKIYRRKGQLAEAALSFAEALRLDPMDFMSALSLGQVYQLLA